MCWTVETLHFTKLVPYFGWCPFQILPFSGHHQHQHHQTPAYAPTARDCANCFNALSHAVCVVHTAAKKELCFRVVQRAGNSESIMAAAMYLGKLSLTIGFHWVLRAFLHQSLSSVNSHRAPAQCRTQNLVQYARRMSEH